MLFDPNQARYSKAIPMPADPDAAPASPGQPVPAFEAPVAASAPPRTGRIRELCTVFGWPGSAILVLGAGLAVASTLWALRLDVPYQVALLAGYVTVAATACVCAALVAVRYYAKAVALATRDAASAIPAAIPDAADVDTGPASEACEAGPPEAAAEPMPAVEAAAPAVDIAEPAPADIAEPAPAVEIPEAVSPDEPAAIENPIDDTEAEPETASGPTEPRPARRSGRPRSGERHARARAPEHQAEPDYAAWARLDRLRVADAARLWCGLAPGDHVTKEVTTWASAMLDAVARGDLPKCETTGVLAQYKNGWHTEIRRDALKAWAAANGHTPRFLGDEDQRLQ
jgi:hypothetical protein